MFKKYEFTCHLLHQENITFQLLYYSHLQLRAYSSQRSAENRKSHGQAPN